MRTRLFGTCMTALVLSLFLGGCLAAKRGGGMAESLAMPFVFEDGEQVWKLALSSGDNAQRVNKFTRTGGRLEEDWTEMVSVITLNKAAGVGTVAEELDAYRTRMTGNCPGSTVEVVRDMPDGVMYELKVKGCDDEEHWLGRMLDGESNFFVVEYAVRGADGIADGPRNEWIDKLAAVSIISGGN